MKSFRSVVCVFSDRVDAGVAALLLKNQGYLVTGLIVKNKYEPAEVESRKAMFAEKICRHLDISLREVELPKSSWDNFTKSAVTEYQRGLSPALDMLYNKHLTFGSVLDYVRKQVGADALATDNYARLVVGEAPIGGFQHLFGTRQEIMEKLVSPTGNHVRLFRGVDSLHDDSQQLCHLSQASLQRALFPLGDFSRAVVLSVAKTFPTLPEFEEPSAIISRDLFRKDIEQVLPRKRASVKLYGSGVVIGDVSDIYSIQEGSKITIDGNTFVVIEKDLEPPNIIVVEDSSHAMLKRSSLFVDMASWISRVPLSFLERGSLDCRFASQPRQKPTPCVITMGTRDENKSPDHIVVSTAEPITGAVRGHYLAFYQGEECLGGAQILSNGPSSGRQQTSSNEQKPLVDYSHLQGVER